MTEINPIVEEVISQNLQLSQQSLLLAISGIDGSVKSTIARGVVEDLKYKNINAVLLNLDAWHNPPEIRFNKNNPAEHFYNHAYRFDDFFSLLINPLKANRSINITLELIRLPENDFYMHTYDLKNVDVIVLEGIFLFRQDLKENYDLAFWVECSFETALERALKRNQEGLSEKEIIHDYETIYFPAQRIHFEKDNPKSNVNGIL